MLLLFTFLLHTCLMGFQRLRCIYKNTSLFIFPRQTNEIIFANCATSLKWVCSTVLRWNCKTWVLPALLVTSCTTDMEITHSNYILWIRVDEGANKDIIILVKVESLNLIDHVYCVICLQMTSLVPVFFSYTISVFSLKKV